MARLLTPAMRFAQQHVRHVRPVRPRHARGQVAAVYRQVERDFGMLAPPISLHSPSPDVMAAAWLVLRETLVASTQASRADKEAVAAAVSEANECPYCVEVHTATLDRVGPPTSSPAAWVTGDAAPPRPVAEYVGVAVCFEYLNRMAHVFLPPSPFPPQAPTVARVQGRRMLGRLAVPSREASVRPGSALGLLPDADLPQDLQWAGGSGVIAGALARATAAFDAAGERSVEPEVRAAVVGALDVRPGLSRRWADDAVAALPQRLRPAGKLAVLVAVAPYQVDDAVVAAVGADDTTVVELVAWAAWTAARHAGLRYAGAGVAS